MRCAPAVGSVVRSLEERDSFEGRGGWEDAATVVGIGGLVEEGGGRDVCVLLSLYTLLSACWRGDDDDDTLEPAVRRLLTLPFSPSLLSPSPALLGLRHLSFEPSFPTEGETFASTILGEAHPSPPRRGDDDDSGVTLPILLSFFPTTSLIDFGRRSNTTTSSLLLPVRLVVTVERGDIVTIRG